MENTNTNRMVTLRSMVNKTVIVNEPAYSIRRVFPNKGAIQTIPFTTVEQLLWSNGFRNMLTTGTLYIDNMQDKIDLGLEEPDTKVPTKIKVLTEEQMLTLMKVRSYGDFVKELSTLPLDQAHALVDYAVKTQTLDSQKINYLRELTGRDALKIISRNRDAEEMDKIQAAKEAARKAARDADVVY